MHTQPSIKKVHGLVAVDVSTQKPGPALASYTGEVE